MANSNLTFESTWSVESFKEAFGISGNIEVKELPNDEKTLIWEVPDPDNKRKTLTGFVSHKLDRKEPMFISLCSDDSKEILLLHNKKEAKVAFTV